MLVYFLQVARGQAALAVSSLEDLPGRTIPIDVSAFRNLTDSAEEDYLRRNLEPTAFRAIQRQRLSAAAEYVRCATHNAAILLRLGEAAQQDGDERVADAGRQLVNLALRVRVYGFLALCELRVRVLFPDLRVSPLFVMDRYERLTDAVAHFTRLQQPGSVIRISTAL
jgi:hypothetical protein